MCLSTCLVFFRTFLIGVALTFSKKFDYSGTQEEFKPCGPDYCCFCKKLVELSNIN